MLKKHLFPIVLLASALIVIAVWMLLMLAGNKGFSRDLAISRFNSCHELATWLNRVPSYNYPAYDTTSPQVSRDGVTSGSGTNSYSTTNVQVAGIDEADGVKTDGKYVYTIRNEKIYVVTADQNTPTVVKILEPNINPTSLYLTENELIVLGTNFGGYGKYALTDDVLDARSSILPVQSISYAYAYDKSDWSLKTSFGVEGSFQSSRLLNDKLYVAVSEWNYSLVAYDQDKVAETFIPKYELNTESKEIGDLNTALTECNQVAYLGDEGKNLISVVELDLANQSVRSEVAIGNASNLYMSYSNLYLLANSSSNIALDSSLPCDPFTAIFGRCPTVPQSFESKTDIYKLNLSQMELTASAEVDGYLLNQYSVDERNDNLRIVTTTNAYSEGITEVSSNVFILDKNLNQVGKLTGLAPSERVYSARFLSERVYLVTFRQVDPLFVIDLSNPSTPTVLGELKVTGYSDYLHNIGENKVLGFGREVDPRKNRVKELKISVFDATKPTRPTELAKLNLELGLDSVVLSNPKALYIELDRERFAMPLLQYGTDGKTTYSFGVYEFDGQQLKQLGIIDRRTAVQNNFYYSPADLRIVRVGDKFLAVGQNTMTVFGYDSLNKLGEVSLN